MTATALVENEKVSFYDKVGALLMDHHFHVSHTFSLKPLLIELRLLCW